MLSRVRAHAKRLQSILFVAVVPPQFHTALCSGGADARRVMRHQSNDYSSFTRRPRGTLHSFTYSSGKGNECCNTSLLRPSDMAGKPTMERHQWRQRFTRHGNRAVSPSAASQPVDYRLRRLAAPSTPTCVIEATLKRQRRAATRRQLRMTSTTVSWIRRCIRAVAPQAEAACWVESCLQ